MGKFDEMMRWMETQCKQVMEEMGFNITRAAASNFTCTKTVPPSYIYLENIDVVSLVLLILVISLTFIMLLVFIVELYYIFKYVSSFTHRPGKLAWLAAIYPYTAMGCIIGLCVPRAMAITEIFVLLYLARCMFLYIELVMDYFGGRLEMSKHLEGTTIQLNIRPLFCCCIWCPHPKPTIQNLRRLELLVYQVAILRPILFLINGVIWADLFGVMVTKNAVATVMTVLQLLSTFTAMYGFLVFAQLVAVPLKEYNVRVSMKLAQFVVIFYNLQGNIFSLIANSGAISCSPLLPAATRANIWNYYLLILETFLLSMASAYFLRPKMNATFNLHPYHLQNESTRKSLLRRGNTREIETQTINEAVVALARQLNDIPTQTVEDENEISNAPIVHRAAIAQQLLESSVKC